MRICRVLPILFLGLAVCLSVQAQQPPKKRKLLCIGQCKGFQHDSASHAVATLWKLGQESGLWETFIRTDTQLITKKKPNAGYNAKNLDYFDAVYFFTSGELDMDPSRRRP